MKKFGVSFTTFNNFSSKKIIECENSNDITLIKLIIWNMIKDEDWDWKLSYNDLEINKIVEISEKNEEK